MKNLHLISLSLLIMFAGCTPEKESNQYDLCIYGGTSAGIIAGYAAQKMGLSVIVIEPSNHLGGLTSGGLGQTDIGNKHAVVALARDFYRRVGSHYNEFEMWKFEPHVASEIYNQYITEANLNIRKNHLLKEVKKEDNSISSIRCVSDTGELVVNAKVFMDCTYEGDLLAKAGVSYTVGRESNDTYNETYNGVQLLEGHQFPDGVDPYVEKGNRSSGLLWGISDEELAPTGSGDNKVQAYNFRICLTDSAENMIPITRPNNYDSTNYELLLRLIEKRKNDDLYSYFIWSMMPNRKTDINNRGGFSTDMIGMNWDYPEATYSERQEIIQAHVDYTKGLLYFWGNDSRVPEKARESMLKWGYPKDEYMNNNHFSPQLYVREARRMIGEHVMTEHHCVGDVVVSDPIALAAYTMDSHNCQRLVVDGMVKNEGNVEIGGFPPYPVSYRSLVPKKDECTNLLVPVCLSASHIAFGSIRMEPVFMVLGQVSAIAASEAIKNGITVQDVDYNQINSIMSDNPLLDGTPPDILIDNDDKASIEITGPWETRQRWMGQYKHNYLMTSGPAEEVAKVTFNAQIKNSSKYTIYYYVPRGRWNQQTEYSNNARAIVSAPNEQLLVPVNLQKHRNGWIKLGSFDLSEGEHVSITIEGGPEVTGAIIADAVLFVPEKQK